MSAALLAAVEGGAPGLINASLPNGSNTATADWQLKNDGTYAVGNGSGGTSTGNWVTPANSTIAAFYQVKVDVTSGAFSSGTTGTWLDLSTTRTWNKTGLGVVVFDVSIREKASGLVRTTQSRSLTAS